jgi:hypothetical protein
MPSTLTFSGSSLCSSLDIDSSLHYNAVYRLIKDAGSKGVVSSVSGLN